MQIDWFIYALLSGVFAGLYSFLLKISAAKNHNASLVTAYSMFSGGIMGLVLFFFSMDGFNPLHVILIASIANGLFYFIATVTRIESLKNIDTTIYFPIYKALGPMLMVGVGLLIFADDLNTKEMIGIALGIIVPLFLMHKSEHKRQVNLKKGLLYLVVGTLFAVASSSIGKVITTNDLNPFLYIAISFIFGGFLSLYLYRRNGHKVSGHSIHRIRRTGITTGAFLMLAVFCFVRSTTGDLGVVYTINSFSILIPIILSIIIYKEHFNVRKGAAIILTIASLFLMR